MADENTPSDEQPTPPTPPAVPRWVLGAGAVAVIALGGLAYQRSRGRPAPPAATSAQLPPGPSGPSAPIVFSDVPFIPPDAYRAWTDGGFRAADAPPLPLPLERREGGAAEHAIVAPLRAGAPLGDAQVERVSPVIDGRVLVHVRQGESRATFGVMLWAPSATQLQRAGRYVVYIHGEAPPTMFGLVPRLVAVLNQHQTDPVPPGMREISITAPAPAPAAAPAPAP